MLSQSCLTLVRLFFKSRSNTRATLGINRVWVTKRGVARWVRPTIEYDHLAGEARSGVYFYGLFVQSLFLCSIFCFIFLTCFSLFWFGCVLFSKIRSFGLSLFFHYFVFYLIVIKLEKGFQNDNLSSFNLVLIWFVKRGFFFLSHAISLWFCVVSKLSCSFQFTI